MNKKYNEFKVTGHVGKDDKFVVVKKELTDRGSVMISERDAEVNNWQTRFNGLYYELAKDNSEREALEQEAKDLGVTFRSDISDEKLADKIKEAKK